MLTRQISLKSICMQNVYHLSRRKWCTVPVEEVLEGEELEEHYKRQREKRLDKVAEFFTKSKNRLCRFCNIKYPIISAPMPGCIY